MAKIIKKVKIADNKSCLSKLDPLLSFKPRRNMISKKAVNDHLKHNSKSTRNAKEVSLKTNDLLSNFKPRKFRILLSKKVVDDYLKFNTKITKNTSEVSLKSVLISSPPVNHTKKLSYKKISKPNNESSKKSINEDRCDLIPEVKGSQNITKNNLSSVPLLKTRTRNHNDKATKCKENETIAPSSGSQKNKIFTTKKAFTITSQNDDNSNLAGNAAENNKESIYDFLTQTITPVKDVSDDIINKLVNEGRAKVVRHRPIIKGKQKKAVTLKKNPIKKKRDNSKKTNVKDKVSKVSNDVMPLSLNIQEQQNNNDNFDQNNKEINNLSENGRFSILARSIMKKQAERMNTATKRPTVTDREKLLKVAQNFVSHSTPANIKKSNSFSPKCSPFQKNNLPWRNEIDTLPNVFNFTVNSELLPSFSCDVIPCTPTKTKTITLLNDSNEENIQPSTHKLTSNNESYKLSLNPRRALFPRPPLKPINIINVTHLPKLQGKKNNDRISNDIVKQPCLQNEENSAILFEKNTLVSEKSVLTPEKSLPMYEKFSIESSSQNENEDPFGFNEIITNEESSIITQSINRATGENAVIPETNVVTLGKSSQVDDKLSNLDNTIKSSSQNDDEDPFGFNEIITNEESSIITQSINRATGENAVIPETNVVTLGKSSQVDDKLSNLDKTIKSSSQNDDEDPFSFNEIITNEELSTLIHSIEESTDKVNLNENQVPSSEESKVISEKSVLIPETSSFESDNKDPFGFDEIITNEEQSIVSQSINRTSSKVHLNKEHLQRFLPKTKPTRFTYGCIKPIFKNSECKSHNIKEMLTSTRIDHPNADANYSVEDSIATTNNESLALFSDVDPETTFDTKSIRRTYCRNIKKERKFRHHNFVMFLDSDDSGSEQEETSAEGQPRHKKRKRKAIEQEDNSKLNEFAEKFNSMCQEVEEFPLVIE